MKLILRTATIIILLALFLNILNAEAATTFSYDKLNRLTGATYADGTSISYTYDAVGNITGTTRTVIPAQTVNGICGNSNGTTSDTVPVTGFCITGIVSTVVGSGPWNWLCQGSHGGQTVGCTAAINFYRLTVTVAGTGAGTVSSTPVGINPAGISCTTGTCASTFPFATAVSLTATADQVSVFDHWGGDCTPSDTTCVATIGNSAHSVSAYFSPAPKAMIVPNSPYGTLMEAYTTTQPGNDYTILSLVTQDTLTAESLMINRGSNIILKGGYKAGFLEKSGSPTLLKSPLRISSGKLTVEGIRVKAVAEQ